MGITVEKEILFCKELLYVSGWQYVRGVFKKSTDSHQLLIVFEGDEIRLDIDSKLLEEDGGEGKATCVYDLRGVGAVQVFARDVHHMEEIAGACNVITQ